MFETTGRVPEIDEMPGGEYDPVHRNHTRGRSHSFVTEESGLFLCIL